MKKGKGFPRWLLVTGIFLLLLGGFSLNAPGDKHPQEYAVPDHGSSSENGTLSQEREYGPPSGEFEEGTAEEESVPLPEGPWISIVVDDFGFSKAMAAEYAALNMPLTWAVIPFQPHSKSTAERAAAAGIPFIVHMPMAAMGDKVWTEKSGVIDTGMSPETVTLLLRKAIASLPGARGMNNHRGSRATGDLSTMKLVMNELAATPLFFLDSRTSSSSVAYGTARKKGMSAGYASIFLDNDSTEESMEKQFRRGLAMADKRGWVVMIGHTRPDTLNFLRKKSSVPPEKGTYITLPVLMELLKEGQHPSPAP